MDSLTCMVWNSIYQECSGHNRLRHDVYILHGQQDWRDCGGDPSFTVLLVGGWSDVGRTGRLFALYR